MPRSDQLIDCHQHGHSYNSWKAIFLTLGTNRIRSCRPSATARTLTWCHKLSDIRSISVTSNTMSMSNFDDQRRMELADSLRPFGTVHGRQLSGAPVQPQSEAVRGIQHRAQSSPRVQAICRLIADIRIIRRMKLQVEFARCFPSRYIAK